MTDSNAPEPTMEEILASIRRIISEDEPPAAAAAPAAAEEPAHEPEPEPEPIFEAEHEDVLELTQLASEEPPPLETLGDLEVHAAEPAPPPPAPKPAPARAPAPASVLSLADEEGLLSPTSAASAASAFGQLAHTVTMPAEGRVLEDVVRELLRPLLKAWLDEHLPPIVQAKVDEEVERIARRRVG